MLYTQKIQIYNFLFIGERDFMAEPIKLPAYVTLTNKTNGIVKFAPYKENFNTTLRGGETLVLTATTVGQVLYYLMQASDSLKVERADAKPEAAATYDVCATQENPVSITITNNSDRAMNFVPYRENFQYTLAANESCEFDATTAGQVIYYMNQDVDGVLDVKVGTKGVGKK